MSLQASPKSKSGGKPRQTGISWEMVHSWWDHGAWNPTLLFVPGSVTFSLTETHLPRMALGMDSDYLSASGSEKYPQREVKLY